MGGTSMEDLSLLRLHYWAWACSDGSIGPFLELYAVWLVVVVAALTGAPLTASANLGVVSV